MCEYTDYLSRTAGLMKGTIYNRLYNTRNFLAAQEKLENFEVTKLKPMDVQKYIFKIADRYERNTLGNTRTTLRSFFKYMHLKGKVDETLAKSVPEMPKWSLSEIPDHMTEKQTQQLLESFDQSRAEGRRNYAIAMVLVHLGLRSGEVAAIELGDIDWKNGILNVRNLKCRRTESLPLPKEVGEAIVEYIKNSRPKSQYKQIFLCHRTNRGRPVNARTVQSNMTYRFKKCRMKLPQYGTHIIRRTVAGRMIQNGASLKEIADVLRHRHLDTTKIYTKINLPALREVALEWPWGGQS
jgi:site-specific recombinase XerD